MLASIYVYNNSNIDAKEIENRLLNARQVFTQYGLVSGLVSWESEKIDQYDQGHIEGRAETYFVESMLYI
jgi:hypothetical protein